MSSTAAVNEEGTEVQIFAQSNVCLQGKQTIHGGGTIGEPLCFGGTQIIQGHKRNKQNPQDRWKEEVYNNTKGKCWTSVCTDRERHLETNSVAVITGSPGEGKTTVAHLLLEKFLQLHWNVAIPKSPKEYFGLKQIGKTMLLFNDIFGTFEFDKSLLKTWVPVLEDLRSRLDWESSENPEMNNGALKIIFVHRDYIWKEAESKIGKFSNNLFKNQNISNISISKSLNKSDKRHLIDTNEKKYNVSLPPEFIKELIDADIPHGFPYCCEKLFHLPGALSNPVEFFSRPIPFLNETLFQFCQDDLKRIVIGVLLKHGGKILIKVINSKEYLEQELLSLALHASSRLTVQRFQQIKNTLQHLCGSYLKQANGFIEFSHPSILQSAIVSMGKFDLDYLLKHCRFTLLKNLLKMAHNGDVQTRGMQNRFINVDSSNVEQVVERCLLEFSSGELQHVLSSRLFKDERFVEQLFHQFPNFSDTVNVKDSQTGKTIFYIASQSDEPFVLKNLITRCSVDKQHISDALFGCCEYGNIKGLKILLQHPYISCVFEKKNANNETPLLSAITNGHPYICQLLLQNAITLDVHDSKGNTAVHLAAERGNTDLLLILIQKSAKLDARNNNKETALHLALTAGYSETARLLLDHGADFTLKEKMGLTALHCASFMGFTTIVRYLIEKGIDIHALNKRGSLAVIKAAEGGHVEIVRLLYDEGCDIQLGNKKGFTALHLACDRGHVKVVKLLIDLGCDIDARSNVGLTGLMLAARFGRMEVVKLLVSSGCNLDICNSVGLPAISHAVTARQVDIAKLLLDKGCRSEWRAEFSVKSLVEMVGHNLEVDSLKSWLFRTGKPVYWLLDFISKNQMTVSVLHIAIINCQLELVNALLDRGMDANISFNDMTPVEVFSQLASMVGFINYLQKLCGGNDTVTLFDPSKIVPVAAKLFEKGADINKQTEIGATDLHHAAGIGSVALMNVLLEAGSTIDKPDHEGRTPLHYAAWNGKTEAVSFLLEKNADPHPADIFQQTPLHYSLLYGHTSEANLLMSKGCSVCAPVRFLYQIPFRICLALLCLFLFLYW